MELHHDSYRIYINNPKTGMTEAEIMRAKGYNQKDVLQAEVQKAYAEGIGNMGPDVSNGGGGSSIVGDMMGLGVGMAAANAIMPQISNMMQGMNTQQPTNTAAPAAPAPAAPSADMWDCPCGQKNIIGNFCNNCGSKRPVAVSGDAWDCSCGLKGIVGNFCNNCGKKRGE